MTDQVMVRFTPGADAEDAARDLGARLLRAPGPSGYARVAVPSGLTQADLVRRARDSTQVLDAGPIAVTHGAKKGGRWAVESVSTEPTTSTTSTTSTTTDVAASAWDGVDADPCRMRTGGRTSRADSRQWHLDAVAAFPPDRIRFDGVTIAVLDTGVAYEDYSDGSGTYAQAPSLADVAIVAPWDFVNDDAHPNDDNQHGTHIASIIASRGDVEGVAPGATLMPLKVLDADNAGNELDLVDAIYHAVDNGADIINMSLSFHPDYPGSAALREALSAAEDAGVFVVAAAGNDGLYTVTWPAAHPAVYAVSANAWSGGSGWTVNNVPGYTNRSARVDILAPGGDLSADDNSDGIPDGVIAETIDPEDPTDIGLWAIAGSSQAAAVVAAAAAYPVAAGHAADMVPFVFSDASWSDSGSTEHSGGLGAGLLLIDQVQWLSCGSNTTMVDPDRVHASVLPVISRSSPGMAAPLAHVKVTDADGAPLSGQVVHATVAGDSAGSISCQTDAAGECLLLGDEVPALADDGSDLPLQWAVSVDVVIDSQSLEPYRPRPVLWSSDALEILLTASHTAGEEDALLALSWEESTDPVLGDIAPGYTVLAGGTGLASSPLGVVFNFAAIADTATVTDTSLDVDGTGLSSSPLGLISMSTIHFSGTGLASSPLGLVNFNLVSFSGTGLASSPLGFSWRTLTTGASAYDSDLIALDGGMIDLQDASIAGASSAGTLTGALVSGGGWVGGGSTLDGASLLLGSATLDAPQQAVEGASDSIAGASAL